MLELNEYFSIMKYLASDEHLILQLDLLHYNYLKNLTNYQLNYWK